MARTSGARAPRRAVTGRALVLGTVLVLLLVLLAAPLSRYFASRTALGAAGQQLRNDQRALGVLHQQLARWNDPGYVQQQARERLQFAMPGDTVYVVVDHGQRNDIARTRAVQGSSTRGSWNTTLWGSVTSADLAK